MKVFGRLTRYFTKFEITLYCTSVALIFVSFFIAGTRNYLTMTASLIGATALIFLAKGNVAGQVLTVIFSVLYGIISVSFSYYGEMLTYLCMTAPIAVASIVTWLKNPSDGKKAEVKINKMRVGEVLFMFAAGAVVTAAFYFILEYFHTANLFFSTVSVTTSFIASYLSMRRSEYYALAYAANDIVLIVLWVMASITDITYLSMVICFAVFLTNDIYGFINWSKMKKNQNAATAAKL